jgi:hypothetical protein
MPHMRHVGLPVALESVRQLSMKKSGLPRELGEVIRQNSTVGNVPLHLEVTKGRVQTQKLVKELEAPYEGLPGSQWELCSRTYRPYSQDYILELHY